MNGSTEYNILSLAVFTLNWKIFMISVVYGYCIVLTAQVLCINTKDRAPHQVFVEVLCMHWKYADANETIAYQEAHPFI